MKILVVGMLDSIHLYRWLIQFKNEDLSITVFPSRRFRKVNQGILELANNGFLKVVPSQKSYRKIYSGYLDFLTCSIVGKYINYFSRGEKLKRIINSNEFSHVHLIEMQNAGYLYLESNQNKNNSYQLIVTNWGSDIYFYQHEMKHLDKIKKLLNLADRYSAECRRDYILAKTFGFQGLELPLIPNTGGIPEEFLHTNLSPISNKKSVYIKGYGGKFGLGAIGIEVGKKLLENFPNLELFIVSVTPDLELSVRNLKNNFPDRVNFWTVRSNLDHKAVFELLKSSILYIGCSKSDGVSTTFLESLAAGAYPIQTNTSCANEWIEMGFKASIVAPTFATVLDSAMHALSNLSATDQKINWNKILSIKYLSPTKIKEVALKFYD
jgi:hypothetical protein